jgi:hypothetical protein
MGIYGAGGGEGATSAQGNVTNTAALYGASAHFTTNLANQYGLYLENMTGATNNYGIYSMGGTNYFASNVGIVLSH